jgi:hypothetical protein
LYSFRFFDHALPDYSAKIIGSIFFFFLLG